MKIFALADPHLSTGIQGKEMDKFGSAWRDHPRSIAANWRDAVGTDDLVLVAGDISWAMRLNQAMSDLQYLASLPGRKVLIRGNHDYWWQAISKVRAALPEKMYALQADAESFGEVHVCGTRLWDVPGVSHSAYIDWSSGGESSKSSADDEEQRLKIYRREVERLKLALKSLQDLAGDSVNPVRIVMIHYPPCDASIPTNELTELFEEFSIHHVIFGHLHDVKRTLSGTLWGQRAGVTYHLTSCDYLEFKPKVIAEIE